MSLSCVSLVHRQWGPVLIYILTINSISQQGNTIEKVNIPASSQYSHANHTLSSRFSSLQRFLGYFLKDFFFKPALLLAAVTSYSWDTPSETALPTWTVSWEYKVIRKGCWQMKGKCHPKIFTKRTLYFCWHECITDKKVDIWHSPADSDLLHLTMLLFASQQLVGCLWLKHCL